MKRMLGTLALLALTHAATTLAAATNEAAATFSVPAAQPANPVLLDGAGLDPVWSRAVTLPSLVLRTGAAPSTACRVQAVRCGRWLLFAMDAVEPGVIVARETQAGATLWSEDAFVVELESGAHKVTLAVNPLGAVDCARDGKFDDAAITAGKVLRAARVTPGAWRAELAVDVGVVLGEEAGPLGLRVKRQRLPRKFDFDEEASFPSAASAAAPLEIGAGWRTAAAVRIDEAPLQHFAGRTILDAICLPAAPAGAAEWAKIPATRLRSEGGRRAEVAGFWPAEVRAVLTPQALILRVTCTEHHPELMEVATDPANIWSTDNIEVCSGPEGYEGLQVETNPTGLVQCVSQRLAGKAARKVDVLPGLAVTPEKTADGWGATFTIPVAALIEFAGAPATHRPENRPWTVQVTRYRPARKALAEVEQASILSVTKSETMRCPSRHALLRPVVADAAAAPAAEPVLALPAPVLDSARRQALQPARLVERWITERKKAAFAEVEKTVAEIKDAAGWKAFAADRRQRLLKSVFYPAGQMPERTPLQPMTAYERKGDGFVIEGVIIESRPNYPMPFTIYRPASVAPDAKLPVLLMIPAWHTARNSQDLQIVGMNLARAGGMAVLVESLGSGERSVTALWEHKCYQRNLAGAQLLLAGEYVSAWTAWDVSRCIDYLLTRNADPARIGLMGAVAGGGAECVLVALLDERITLSIPFNASHPEASGAYFDPILFFPDAQKNGINLWMASALRAPRPLIQAQEFAWGPYEQKAYAQFQHVYGLFDATNRLDFMHGGPSTHATHFNWMHRIPVNQILNRWWNLSLPETREAEYNKTISIDKLYCLSSDAGYRYQAENLARLREPNTIAAELARAKREAARARRNGQPEALRKDLDQLLGSTRPEVVMAEKKPLGTWRDNPVEGLWMITEAPRAAGAPVPGAALWVITPKDAKPGKHPVVLGIAHGGKAQFLADCAEDVTRLLAAGVSVALLDVRGTGETSPGESQFPVGTAADLAGELWMFGESFTSGQVQDARAALHYLANRPDVDAGAIGLWGEALTDPNGVSDKPLLFDETGFRQNTPQPKNYLEPLGGTVAMLAALYPIDTAEGKTVRPRGVLVRGALASYASVLDRRYHYLPGDAVIPRLAAVADMDDVAGALAAENVAVFGEDFRDGSNRTVAGNPWNLKPAPAGAAFLQAIVR
jgi:dienelactone hydrolase